ncbi:MAG TPA: energy transducer TonB [Bacteroidales bacterium]|nr:energy transducer TonB [Bacteroidales bacterium]
MEKSKKRVPEFDEIIFENRNKSYGAYDLRKRYKSTASFSVLSGAAIITMIVIGLSMTIDRSIASRPEPEVIVLKLDPFKPDFIEPEEIKAPENMMKDVIHNLKPVVTDDTAGLTAYINTADDLIGMVTNTNVNDTAATVTTTDPVTTEVTEPRVFVEEMPEFPGGPAELLKTIARNLKYPDAAIENNIQGKVVLKFVVNTDGSIDRITLLRGVDPELDNEAIRVIGGLPKFRPGKQNGIPVPVWYTIPVSFRLQ